MRIFINEYTKIFAYTILGIIFAYASFYLFANIYHYQEVRKTYDIKVEEMDNYHNIISNVKKIEKNTEADVNKYKGSTDKLMMFQLKSGLSTCATNLNNEDLKKLSKKEKITVIDVENFRQQIVNNVINDCLIGSLYFVTSPKQNVKFLEQDRDLIKMEIDSINKKAEYMNRYVNNNSSLSFQTESAKHNTFDSVGDSFQYLFDIYEDSSKLVLEISNKYNKEVTDND